jgi:hypothetical protein
MRPFLRRLVLITALAAQTVLLFGQVEPRVARDAWLQNASPLQRVSKLAPRTLLSIAADTSNWKALETGLSGYGEALATRDSALFVGGIFMTAGGQPSQGIALWNGYWSGVGGGTNGFVYAVAVRGNDVYVAGQFTLVGGSISANNIARWDGSAWHALSNGLTSTGGGAYILTLAFRDTILFVGGSFNRAGSLAANNLARWNGVTWDTVAGAPAGTVSALAVNANDLYVGGAFTSAGSVPQTHHLARWNGSQWFDIGGGTNNTVVAIAFQGSDVLVGGFFDTVGTVRARSIGRWTGTTWQGVGYGLANCVNSIVPQTDGTIFAGGNFNYKYTATDSTPIGYVAAWRNGEWQPLESGLNGPANAIVYDRGDLYVTGYFTTAGGKSVNGIAVYREKTETSYLQGWNLASMPRLARSTATDDVFPTAQGIYRYTSQGYSRPTTIEFGRGYWAYYAAPTVNAVYGSNADSASVTAASGNSWILIGGLTLPASVSVITSTPPNSFGQVFGYSGTAYTQTVTLEPGRGYWLYIMQPCTIHIVGH